MISVRVFLCFEVAAAAALALWVVTRFPHLNPKSLRSAFVRCLAALAFVQLTPLGTGAALHLPYGVYVVLFGFALPAFLVAFVAAAWLLGFLAGAISGSGGGPGDPVRASR